MRRLLLAPIFLVPFFGLGTFDALRAEELVVATHIIRGTVYDVDGPPLTKPEDVVTIRLYRHDEEKPLNLYVPYLYETQSTVGDGTFTVTIPADAVPYDVQVGKKIEKSHSLALVFRRGGKDMRMIVGLHGNATETQVLNVTVPEPVSEPARAPCAPTIRRTKCRLRMR
jgi:hypothetical protein